MYNKIDIYLKVIDNPNGTNDWQYFSSTNQSRTIKEAINRMSNRTIKPSHLTSKTFGKIVQIEPRKWADAQYYIKGVRDNG